jgi:flavorubredoxin
VKTYHATSDIDVITSDIPIPGFGLVPVNAFVIKGQEPILVDTGAVIESDEFMTALRSVIDPAELRWIWLTHTDFDHIGCLHPLLEANQQLRLVTTFLGVGIMSLFAPLPMDRLYLLNPGQKLTAGDRTLAAFKPPLFDNPSTTGFLDESSGVLFSSDCFGALLQEVPENAADLTDEQLREGQVFWGTVDSPWVHKVDEAVLAKELDAVRAMKPEMVLSSHLPAASGDQMDRLLASLAAVPGAQPFVGPDQAALEQMLKEMTAGAQ